MTNTPRQCPKCGSTLAPDAPEGLCPACLMAGALPTDATIKLTPSQMHTPSHGPVAPPPEELAPLFPQLEILELLGRGGMGAVYKARQPKLNRFVALKIIAGDAAADPHFAERFQREAQALAKLNHPHIVSVFDFGETGGLFYFLMEFVDGANLRTLMQSGEMKPEAALALIPAFCDALQYAHDEGVVHRDIKPENVLVDKKGRLKIADFGLAKLTGSDAHDHTLTRTGMYLGTPRYMAPEQVEKPETVDHRADIYSLGVVFYEMLTGELPMGRFDPPSKKAGVDVKLDDIVLRSLEKDVDRRYQHASEIKTDVQGVTAKPQAVVTPAANSDDENVDEDEVEVVEHPVFAQIWRFFPLGVILLVFISMFSSWGSNIWPYFGIGVAVLAVASGCFSTITRKKDGMQKTAVSTPDSSAPRLSRMALIGAIWALFGLIAVIPSMLLTKTVDLAEGRPSGLVYEQPPLAFTIFMGVLLFIGMGAPIGTTILGAISMSNIKKSGGKLYGLPLAFADTVFFPMLLLHGAMAVMLGLLIPTIMKLAGVNAGLGVLEMGLLAMLPLIADFFIVRAFWRKVSGAELSSSPSVAQPFAGSGMHLALCVLLSVMTLWFVLEFGFPVAEMITGPDLPLIEIGRQWHLGSTVDSIFSKFVAILALLGAGTFFSWRSYRRAVRDGASAAATGGDLQTRTIIIAATVVVVIVGVALLFRARPGSGGSATSLLGNLFTSDSALIVAEGPGTKEPDHDLCRYKISAPPNHRVVVWMEVTREGKPVVVPGLANRIEIAEQLPIGESFEGYAEFSIMDGSRISPDSKGKWRWDFKFGSRTMRTAPGGWIDNPFEGKGMRQMDLGPQRWQPKPGETVSVMVIRAGKQFSGSDFTQQPPAGEVEFRLKARIDLVPLFHRRVSGISSTSSAPHPAPEKPLGKIAAGFEIDTKLSDDDIRRALIEKLKTNPSKRADAEAILKSINAAPAEKATPEEVAKALERAAEELQ